MPRSEQQNLALTVGQTINLNLELEGVSRPGACHDHGRDSDH
jgi:hypothetical protein